jgi:hypothetical protein
VRRGEARIHAVHDRHEQVGGKAEDLRKRYSAREFVTTTSASASCGRISSMG